MTRITNLRPKNGANLVIDDENLMLIGTHLMDFQIIRIENLERYFDYDVVPPEYKTGDIVIISYKDKLYKGFVAKVEEEGLFAAVEDYFETFWFKDNLSILESGTRKIVGLWEEKQ